MNEQKRQRTVSGGTRLVVLAVGTAFLCAATIAAPGDEFDLSRYSIDGGGMGATGGEFELSGTIGQPDAATMTGGGFQLTGGFWFETPPGDCDADGLTNLAEYAAFEACMAGPADPPSPECDCYDVNRDGQIDLRDFAIFQAAFNAHD